MLIRGWLLPGVWALGLLLCAVPARAETQLRIAGGLLPQGKGNPLRSSSQPYAHIYAALFDTLTHVTAQGDVVPWLAVRWEQIAPKRWRFHLRPNVTFSNGEPMDAAAVAATISYLTSFEGQREVVASRIPASLAATVVDPLTVDLTTPQADPLLPRRFGDLWILPPKLWAAAGPDGFADAPSGTGPYVLTKWTTGRIEMKRNALSWRQAPTDRLDVLSVDLPAARNTALITHRADIALGSVEPESAEDIVRAGASVAVVPLSAAIGVGFITAVKDSPFRDVRVRQALNYAVDKEAIARVLLQGRAKIASQASVTGFFGHNAAIAPYPYDPERARALLREAGLPNGFTFVMQLASGAALWDGIFLKAAMDLARIGVQMEIRTVPAQVIAHNEREGGWEGSAWGAGYVSSAFDALDPLRQTSCLRPTSPFCDEAMMPAINTALAAETLEDRRRATEAVMVQTHDRAQGLFIYESIAFIGVAARVKNFQSDFGFIRYEDLAVAPE